MSAAKGTPGAVLADQLMQAIHAVESALLPGARHLPVLTGLGSQQTFLASQENVLQNAGNLLALSERIYNYGDTIVMEIGTGGRARLVPLRIGTTVERAAHSLLANVMICSIGEGQSPPPAWFTDLLLLSDPLQDTLPTIRTYARRPLFDTHFHLCQPGWNKESGILIHGPAIEPITFQLIPGDRPAIERLPHHLQTLLAGFCFRADVDLVNMVGFFLTGLLMNHFFEDGKPILLVDGNQSLVGKSWLVRILAILMDGKEPPPIRYTPDEEELQKSLCATLRDASVSVLMIDNAKLANGTLLSSATIESQSLAPGIALRILGHSTLLQRPNDVIWAITMNKTRANDDIITRGVPVQLFYAGQPRNRNFSGPHPIAYAREHRLHILGELAGIIVHWLQQGRSLGSQTHRCGLWARMIGGILESAGFPEFLTNLDATATAFSSTLDNLSALAEAAMKAKCAVLVVGDEQTKPSDAAKAPSEWSPVFRDAGILKEELEAAKGTHGKSVVIGGFLTPMVDRQVPLEARSRTGNATLRCIEGRSRRKLYYFQVVWDATLNENPTDAAASSAPGQASPTQCNLAVEAMRGQHDDYTSTSMADDTRAEPHEGGPSTTVNTTTAFVTADDAVALPSNTPTTEPSRGGNGENW